MSTLSIRRLLRGDRHYIVRFKGKHEPEIVKIEAGSRMMPNENSYMFATRLGDPRRHSLNDIDELYTEVFDHALGRTKLSAYRNSPLNKVDEARSVALKRGSDLLVNETRTRPGRKDDLRVYPLNNDGFLIHRRVYRHITKEDFYYIKRGFKVGDEIIRVHEADISADSMDKICLAYSKFKLRGGDNE